MPQKPTLMPPSQPPAFPTDPHASRAKRRALIALVLLMLIAVAVAFILPHWLGGPSEQTHEPPAVRTAPTPQPAADVTSPMANEAKQLLQKALQLKARLDNERAKIWGAEELDTSYGQTMKLLEEANENLDAGRFNMAAQRYRDTISSLEQLEKSRAERAKRSIQAGNEALEYPDAEAARQSFEIARAADIDSNEARTGLQRAAVLPQVIEYIAQGRAKEDNGLFADARSLYEQALALDKDSKTAREHLQRVDSLIAERDFQRSMSGAMSAFNSGDIGLARSQLNTAKKIKPRDEALRDLERQIGAAERSAALQRLSRQAAHHEQNEQWAQALQLYNRALKIDASAAFAQRGKVRAERFTTLDRAIRKYLDNPENLQATEHRHHARGICATAMASGDTGPKLTARVEQLRSLVERYARPATILLRSDGMTDVRIYRVGRVGSFLEHSLQLTPGIYKALGTRSEYRDVTIEFTVPADGTSATVRIVCKEKI